MYCVAGLDRGFAANSSAAAAVEAAVASLISVSPPVILAWSLGRFAVIVREFLGASLGVQSLCHVLGSSWQLG